MSQYLSWHTVKVPSFPVVVVCVAAEKGWIQPVSHKPLSSLRLLSGPGSPKKRVFTLHCACYSSQHSTHGHVSVFIALNLNFHSHRVLCLQRIFSYPNTFLLSNTIKYILRVPQFSLFLSYRIMLKKHILLHSRGTSKCYSVSFKHYVSNPVAWEGRKMLPASLLGSWEYLQKKQQECQGSRLWDQGITLLIKIQVALLPMGIQCNTLDWIR